MRIDQKSWLLSCMLFLWLNSPGQAFAQGKWHSHTDWELKPSRSGSLAAAEWFAPVSQSTNWLMFTHLGLGGNFDHDEAREIELGIGYRHLYERWIWGGYALVERRDSANGNPFNQLSFGFEALSDVWDARLNGYLPDPESKRLRTLDQVDLTNSFVAVRLGQERALPGFDAEVGRRVATMRDSRLYGGGFYFFDTDNFKGNYGSRLRFESRFYDLGAIGVGSRLTLGAEVSYDSKREFRIAGSLRLRLPLGSARRQGQPRLSSLERRMLDPVVRRLDDVTGQGHGSPIRAFVYNSATGTPADLGVLDADDSGRVHDIVAQARDHSVFFVTGTVRNSEVIALGEGQSFSGHIPDRSISVNFFEPDGGLGQLSFTLEGEPGSIHGEDPAKDVFRVPVNVSAVNVFENLTISGGLDGIGVPDEPGAGDNRAKVAVRNSVIENVTGNAISIGDLSDLEIDGVTIRKTGGDGIFANSENRIRVSNSTITELAMSGLMLGNRNHVTLAHTAIEGTGRECEAGIGTSGSTLCGAGLAAGAGNTIEAANLDIANVAWRGINLGAGNDVTATGAALRHVGREGIAASGGGNALRLTGVTVAEAGLASDQEGIQVTGHGNEVVLTDVTVSGTANDGIRITGSAEQGASPNTLVFTGVRVDNARDDGIQIDVNNHVDMTDIQVLDVGGDGLHFGDGNDIALNGFGIRNATAGVGLRLGDRNTVAIGTSAALARNSIDGTGKACEENGPDALCGAGLAAGADNTIEAANLDITNVAWRGINLGAGNDVTATGAALRHVGHEGIAASGGGNALRLTGVTVAEAGLASDQEGIQVTGHGNEVVLTDVTVSGTANDGIRITGSAEQGASPNTLVFTGVRVDNARDDGIQIDVNNHVDMTDIQVLDVGGDGLHFGDGNDIALNGFGIRNATAGVGLRLGDRNTVAIGSGTALARNTINGTGSGCESTGGSSRCGAGFTAETDNTIEAANLDITNVAWRGINLGAGNDVTATGAALRHVGHEGIAASGGGNALRLTGVTVAEAGLASDQEGIQVTGHGNEVVLTDVTVSGTANDGIRITGSAEQGASPNTLVFTGVRVDNARDDGIQIDVNNDVYMTDTRISDVAGDGTKIGHGNKNVLLDGFEIRRTGGNGLTIGDENNVTIYPGTDIERNLIEDTGRACTSDADSRCGAGLAADSRNEIVMEDLDIVNSAWRAIDLRAGNNVTMTHVDITSAGYEGVAASGGGNALRLTGVTVAEAGLASDQEGIQVTGHGNEVVLTDVTVSGTANDGIRITGSAEQGASPNTLVFTGVRVDNARDDGIQIDVNNNVAMTDIQVIDVGGDGLNFGDANDIAMNGFEIRNAAAVGLRLGNLNTVAIGSGAALARNTINGTGSGCESTGGSSRCGAGFTAETDNTIEAENLDISNVAWRGVNLGADNDLTVTGATLRHVGYEGVAASGGGNALRLAGVTVAEVGLASNQEGIQVTGHSNRIILLDSVISGTTNDAIRVTGSSTAGPGAANILILDNVLISDTFNDGDGIHLDNNNELALKNLTFKNIDGRTILVRQFGNVLTDEGGNSVDILDCSVHADTSGEIRFAPRPDDTERSIAGRCGP